MTRITILTQYFPPETGAPQNRLHSLAKFLKKEGQEVVVVTALPNYPKNKIFDGYKGRLSVREEIDSIPVHRTWIFVSSSRGVVSRLMNYFSFVVTSFFKLLFLRKADYLLCESPPLFLGMTAVVISKIKGSKLIFNVSDLWPESAEKLNIISDGLMLRLAYKLEAWIYRNSFLISGQTQGIVASIKGRFPDKKVIWFPNGVDLDFFGGPFETIDWRKDLGFSSDDFVLLYAGIIGHAQGLEVILKAAAILQNRPAKIVMVGDGPVKESLMQWASEKGMKNVTFIGNLPKAKIPSLIQTCDAYIVPLKKLDLFKGAIPSKLFEPLSMGKPILLGVDGEARKLFIDEGQSGLYFEPENEQELARQVEVLMSDRNLTSKLGKQGQAYVKANFDRQVIHQRVLNSFTT